MSPVPNSNFFDVLSASFRSAMQPSNSEVSPVALLWTDADGQWLPLVNSLRSLVPHLYTLGPYDPERRTGPSIWLKCIVARTVPEAPPAGEIPIIYMPRVSRQELRAGGDCPPALQPMVELQFRGRVWYQANGQDWTVKAFLVSDGGLGLDVASDQRTEEAFLRALPLLLDVDLKTLRGRRLDASDFDKLAVQDPIRDLLMWLNGPSAFEATAKGARWDSFRGICGTEFGLNPDKVPPSEVAGRIILGDSKLESVWKRFEEAPNLYPGVAKLMLQPAGLDQGKLILDSSRDPRVNESDEAELRKALEEITKLSHKTACQRVLELESRHAERRNWVWARTGSSPWAMALKTLAHLANGAKRPIGGVTVADAASQYAESGWGCDQAAIEALTCFSGGPDAVLQANVVRSLYEPWLDSSARHFQSLVIEHPDQAKQLIVHTRTEKDACILFVDGLRFDIAMQLAAQLEASSFNVSKKHRLAPIPTVTATAKPLASPILDGIKGGTGEDFTPLSQSKSGWKPLTAQLMRERLEGDGVEVLPASELMIPSGADRGGWTEFGKIDEKGHSLQEELAHMLQSEVGKIAHRIQSLIDSGWHQVRVVTDHGWLLLPGGLPKVNLESYLVETKWARCAMVKGNPDLSVPVSSWYWNPEVRVASPIGIGSFRSGESYAHGGISPQECVVPEFLVSRGSGAVQVSIKSIEWRGLRCKIRVLSNDPSVRVDLRTNWKQEASSVVAAVKEIGSDGEVSLVVPNDSLEGAAAHLVLLGAGGSVLTSQNVSIGGNA